MCSDKQSIIDKENDYKKKNETEITFGDLASDIIPRQQQSKPNLT